MSGHADYLVVLASSASSDGIVDGGDKKKLIEAARWVENAEHLLARARAYVDEPVLYAAICILLGVRDDFKERHG